MLVKKLTHIWKDTNKPFFISDKGKLSFKEILNIRIDGINFLKKGDVVSLIGDFNPESIFTLLSLIDKGCIVVPLTSDTKSQHEYFFNESKTQYVFEQNKLVNVLRKRQIRNSLLDKLRNTNHPGLILFTTGTTGNPKAILHDFAPFISRYKTPRPPLKALSFLLFDHIGGLNTLLHMLFNRGTVVTIKKRSVNLVLETCKKYGIELLPTTPTFLRLLSLSPEIEKSFPKSIKIISYGTERLDQPTLDFLCEKLSQVDFRQTYGMSELGILRIKSLNRKSLFMKVGGEGVETKIKDNILYIKAENRMMGYLNSKSPFDKEGWFCTKDIVKEMDDNYIQITGRDSDLINVGGLKFMPSEVENICLRYKGIKHVKVTGRENPITGQHVELLVESNKSIDKSSLRKYLKVNLPKHMIPLKIIFGEVKLSHRFKKS